MEFPTQYSESVRKGSKQAFTKPSMTEPDNAMSIPEIIAKFTRGFGMPVQQHPWQSGSATEPDGYNPNDAAEEAFFEQPVPALPEPASASAPQEPAPQEPAPQAQ